MPQENSLIPPTTTTPIHIACDDGFALPALCVMPLGGSPLPGLLFIHEAFGCNQEMERIAREIAAAGYLVLLPDLFARGSWWRCIRRLMSDLANGHGRGVDDLLAARRWLTAHPRVQADRLAVMGLCMGGGFALLLAKGGLFRAAAPFYGQTPVDLSDACPIVASFGGRDRITRAHATELRRQVREHGIPHDIAVYPDAGHSFMNRAPGPLIGAIARLLPSRSAHHPAAAADAMRRVLAFLDQHLAPGSP